MRLHVPNFVNPETMKTKSKLIKAIQTHGTEEPGTMKITVEGKEYKIVPGHGESITAECDGHSETFESIRHLFIAKKEWYDTRREARKA